ncbi:hypothetical protein HPP92_023021 [Vanilla planifolia]|uniref:Peroxidase n=1 Tax=Vanilla planifolia TaxID=51239 RepID=A0A835UFZ0_VANPL|nr:hypothetical protein HPP92_023021 [Vanilla planifolia]
MALFPFSRAVISPQRGEETRTPMSAILFLSFLLLCLAGRAESTKAAAGASGKRSPVHRHLLSSDFYVKTCPEVEQLVGSVTSQRHKVAPSVGPATIRLFFHDCFVQGCDASILLAPGSEGKGEAVEREMGENRNLSPVGFDTIDLAKSAVEKKCPGVVSCADILAIAARDFVHLAGGPYYEVKKGRKDSKAPAVNLANKVRFGLPRANSTVNELLTLFAAKGLGPADLVVLSGAHTIGFAHCSHFVGRLYDGGGDPTMNRQLLQALRLQCPRSGGNADVVAPLDVETPFEFDGKYYEGLGKGMGVLGSDQALWNDPRMRPVVEKMATGGKGASLRRSQRDGKDGEIQVKQGRSGEIRRDCARHLAN